MLVMGLDVGTTGAKAAVFDENGRMLGYGFEEYGVECPAPGRAEQDGEAVFSALRRVMAQAAKENGSEVAALSLSVQGDAAAPADTDGRPLGRFHLGMDYRAQEQAEAFSYEFGDQNLFRRTGMRPHPMNTLCKIRWLTEHEPLPGGVRMMTYADWLLLRLGADFPAIDLTMATRTMGMDLSTLEWDGELLQAAGISMEQLSRPVRPGTVVGRLPRPLAEQTGIRPGALLVAGGHDQVCAALGAGLTGPGLALDSHGTAEAVSTVLPAPRLDEVMFRSSFPCYAHAVPGAWFTFSLNHTAGILLKWFVEGFCGDDAQPARERGERLYEYVLKRAGDAPSPLIVLPSFNGSATPVCDLKTRGAVIGLTLASSRYDIARGILDSLGYSMRENLEAMAEAGLDVRALRCVGGGARSPIGLQIKADVAGIPVYTLRVREAACLGAAMLAGTAAGMWSSLSEAAGAVVQSDQEYLPRPRVTRIYDEKYMLYREACRVNREFLHKLSQVSCCDSK